VNLFKLLVAQKTVDDDDSGELESDGLHTRRLEYQPSLVTKPARQKGVYEPLNILAWVRNVSDSIKRIRWLSPMVRLDRAPMRLLISEQAQDLPFNVWKLALEDLFAKV
jgi:hypothetical protein